MGEHGHDDLARDLAALGRAVDVSAPGADFVVRVMERLPEEPRHPPVGSRPRPRSRRVALALATAVGLLALLATPPVRAAVADWFGFGGVRVERGGSPAPDATASPPAVRPGGSVAAAAGAVGFPLAVPEALGEPDGVEVSQDRRVVSMSWETGEEGVLRLDQFDAGLDHSVLKVVPDVHWTAVDGEAALWFAEPHELALLGPDGTPVTHSSRLAGPSLVWTRDGVTLRLEGDVALDRAVEIAESVIPVT